MHEVGDPFASSQCVLVGLKVDHSPWDAAFRVAGASHAGAATVVVLPGLVRMVLAAPTRTLADRAIRVAGSKVVFHCAIVASDLPMR